MKITILGGAGAMGTVAVNDLAEYTNHNIVVADLDGDAAVSVARDTGSENVTAQQIDLRDKEAVIDLCREADLVANATYMSFVPYITEIAVEAGTDLVDLGAYLERTREQFQFADRAADNDVTVVPGCGVAPGLTNILAKYGAEKMDEVDKVKIYSYITHPLHSSPGILFTRFDAISEPADIIMDGELTEVDSFSLEEDVRFPDPYGEQTVHIAPHPEPFTFVDTFDDLDEAWFKVGYPEGEVETLRTLEELGLTMESSIDIDDEEVSPREVVAACMDQQDFSFPDRTVNAKKVELIGERDDEHYDLEYEFYHVTEEGMASEAITGSVLAIVADHVLENETPAGIIPPEELEADTLVSEILKRGFTIRERQCTTGELD